MTAVGLLLLIFCALFAGFCLVEMAKLILQRFKKP